MYLSKRALLMVSVLTMALFGCRQVHHYGYEIIEMDLIGGDFGIDVVGRYGKEYKEKGKDFLDWGAPYSITFDYVVTPSDDLAKLVVKDIQLVGEKTSSRHKLADIQGDKVRVYGKRKLIRISAGPLTAEEYEYQNYTLKATVIIYKTTMKFEEKKIEVLLKTEYRKERRSDWFDEKMSV